MGNQANSAGSGVCPAAGEPTLLGLPVTLAGAFFNPAGLHHAGFRRARERGKKHHSRSRLVLNELFGRAQLPARRQPALDRDFALPAANFLNNVNIQRLGATVNSSNFGLPIAASDMRTLTLTLRVRFLSSLDLNQSRMRKLAASFEAQHRARPTASALAAGRGGPQFPCFSPSPPSPRSRKTPISSVSKPQPALVVVNVAVQDRDGNPIEGLTAQDFRLFEDKDRQEISVFEFQRMAGPAPRAPEARRSPPRRRPSGRGSTPKSPPPRPVRCSTKTAGLLVLFFDFSSMPPEDQIRAQKSALEFLDEHMTESDLVSVMTFSSELSVVQDFTADRELLREIIGAFRIGEGSELAELFETDEELMEDDGAAFSADETEFNVFNTDRKLSALEDAARMLGSLPEKKALVYFSSGVGRTGVENDSQLRSTINAAVRANLSFYPVDARGLVAEAPAGDARQGASRWLIHFPLVAPSGSAESVSRNEQDTLVSLAEDTGGKALLDNNDLSMGIVQAQQAISSYYILGYYSTNPRHGRTLSPCARRDPRALQSQARLSLGLLRTQGFRALHFRRPRATARRGVAAGRPRSPTSPWPSRSITSGSTPIATSSPSRSRSPAPSSSWRARAAPSRRASTLIGQVRNFRGMLLGVVRDEIRVDFDAEASSQLGLRNLQYDSGFTLPPGRYRLKFLARENQTGKMGTSRDEL